MSLVVLQLFPTLEPHRAGCISPLTNERKNTSNQPKVGKYLLEKKKT